MTDQEFEIKTFKVENGQSQSKTRRINNTKVKRGKNKTNELSQERSSDSSNGLSNYKPSLDSSTSSKQSNQQSDQQKSQECGSNAGNFSHHSQQHSQGINFYNQSPLAQYQHEHTYSPQQQWSP